MEENLVIVESPAKAKTIQKFLGDNFVVMSSFGHIRDLQGSKLSVDVENNFEPKYVVPTEKKKVVSELKKAAKNATTIWLASDEDREGEAISWHLFETLNLKKENTKRIVFHEITKNAILKAIEEPRHIDMNLVDAQQARRVLDRLVGFELSPVLWRKIQPKLSAGRVQSVALRLIVDKEREIIDFEQTPYYRVKGDFILQNNDLGQNIIKANLNKRFDNIEETEKFLQDSKDANYKIESMEQKEASQHPTAPFTTSTLQQEASRKLRFPVALTMRVAQQLYERGLITYMRTDSTNLSGLAINTAKEFIINNYGSEYSQPRQFKTKSKGAQEAHEAIRPTFISNTEIKGDEREVKLYNLIWQRTVASQMSPAKLLKTNIKIESDKRAELFTSKASQILFDGFLKVYIEGKDEEGEDEEAFLPQVSVGDGLNNLEINAECKFTQAPARYSEATLVKKLEELGIGRPSTYAPTITTLTTGRGYVSKGDKQGKPIEVTNMVLKNGEIKHSTKTETVGADRKKLLPQEIGMIVTDYLVEHFESIMNYDFTANVEEEFDDIAEGDKKWNDVIGKFYTPFHDKVETTLKDGEYAHVERELGVDKDGEKIFAKFGQYGPYVQKGEGENRKFASLNKGQLIENITLEDALNLFKLPRTVGEYKGFEVVAMKGRYGPYLKYNEKNYSLPRGVDPISVDLTKCIEVIDEINSRPPTNVAILEFKDEDIQVISGRYGPYIKHDGGNYKLPKGTDAEALTLEACQEIIKNTKPSGRGRAKAGSKKTTTKKTATKKTAKKATTKKSSTKKTTTKKASKKS